MTEFVANLEKFSATEQVEHFKINAAGLRGSPDVRSFDYVVLVSRNRWGLFQLDEYRNGSVDPAQFPAGIATVGLPAMALIFHPILASDFDFKCEGLGQSGGRAAWQIHFAQRPDRPSRIRQYIIQKNSYPVPIKGRAWIDPGTDQVVRLDSELIKPIPEIALAKERLSIEYGSVEFHSNRDGAGSRRSPNFTRSAAQPAIIAGMHSRTSNSSPSQRTRAFNRRKRTFSQTPRIATLPEFSQCSLCRDQRFNRSPSHSQSRPARPYLNPWGPARTFAFP